MTTDNDKTPKNVFQDYPPGSDVARSNGCNCAVMDNEYGRGYLGDGSKYGWVTRGDCPLHGMADDD